MRILFIRADANSQIGTGHVMRCLAIAQAWLDQGGEAVFLMHNPGTSLKDRVERAGCRVLEMSSEPGSRVDAEQTSRLAGEHQAEWLVVDGYQFGAEYQDLVKASGLRLLFLDDCGHAGRYSADLVLNHNLHAAESLYRDRAPDTELLLGPRYALLRREFLSWREWTREIREDVRQVLVTLGGSDPDNMTEQVIRALSLVDMNGMKATVLIGASNPRHSDLRKAAAGLAGVFLVENALNMAELIAEADVAVSGAGSTCWELCFLGLPSLLIDLAENQRPVSRELERLGVAVDLGGSEEVSPEKIADELSRLMRSPGRRAAMSACGRGLIDGAGAARVCGELESRCLRLRKAIEADCALLWEWASDPQIRAAAFSPDAIPWENHVKWFTARMADPDSVFYIALNAGATAVGQVRYQLQQDRAVLSLNLGREFRGKGYSRRLVKLANQKLFQSSNVKFVDAYVKPDNAASLKTFASAGFRREGMIEVHGESAIHFTFDRNGVES